MSEEFKPWMRKAVEQPEGSVPPPRESEYGDRMHQILSIAGGQTNPRYSLFGHVYNFSVDSPQWLNWLVENGYLWREGFYQSYPEDGPLDRITPKGRMWLFLEGHRSK